MQVKEAIGAWRVVEEGNCPGVNWLRDKVRTHVWVADFSGTMHGAGGVGGLVATVIHNGPNAEVYFPVYDGNGNVMGYMRASDGVMVAPYEYGPFGELLRATGSLAQTFNHLFSTKYFDWETGLSYYGHRYYSPTTGRWLSRDPIGEDGGDNVYAFVQNNPLNSYDIEGLLGGGGGARPNQGAPCCLKSKPAWELVGHQSLDDCIGCWIKPYSTGGPGMLIQMFSTGGGVLISLSSATAGTLISIPGVSLTMYEGSLALQGWIDCDRPICIKWGKWNRVWVPSPNPIPRGRVPSPNGHWKWECVDQSVQP
jgi:RHS repeat-associated protein